MPSMAEERYLDLKNLSAYSSLSVRTLWNYIADSDNPLPHFRLKKKVLVRRSEFDRWMEAHRFEGNRLDALVDEIINDL
jgi:predicted DNA-binding transcriptional regulator AlpA